MSRKLMSGVIVGLMVVIAVCLYVGTASAHSKGCGDVEYGQVSSEHYTECPPPTTEPPTTVPPTTTPPETPTTVPDKPVVPTEPQVPTVVAAPKAVVSAPAFTG